jgi:hypothetical protein
MNRDPDWCLALAIMTLETIADGRVGPEQAAHYNAHRDAVKAARNALAAINGPTTKEQPHEP